LIDDKKAIRIAESVDLQVFSVPISLLDAYKHQEINDGKFDLTEEEVEAILGNNAAKLLGISKRLHTFE